MTIKIYIDLKTLLNGWTYKKKRDISNHVLYNCLLQCYLLMFFKMADTKIYCVIPNKDTALKKNISSSNITTEIQCLFFKITNVLCVRVCISRTDEPSLQDRQMNIHDTAPISWEREARHIYVTHVCHPLPVRHQLCFFSHPTAYCITSRLLSPFLFLHKAMIYLIYLHYMIHLTSIPLWQSCSVLCCNTFV